MRLCPPDSTLSPEIFTIFGFYFSQWHPDLLHSRSFAILKFRKAYVYIHYNGKKEEEAIETVVLVSFLCVTWQYDGNELKFCLTST